MKIKIQINIMLKRYLDFINESIDLLFESNVIYSDKFRLALTKCNDPISKKILEIENKDLNVQSNYFDVASDKNDTVSFIPDRRAQQIIADKKELYRFTGGLGGWLTHNIDANGYIFDALGYVPEGEVYKPQSSDIGEIVKKVVSPTSGKTYAYVKFQNGNKGVYNVERLQLVDDSSKQVWNTNRQEIKVGRAIRALLTAAGEKFTDKDIESFVNKYKATIDKMNDKFFNFEVVTGDKISYWYNSEHYYKKTGTLGNSCMADAPKEYFEIYTSNEDKCALVIYKHPDNPSTICGRALLWTLPDGKRFMDRIYTINDSDVQLFRDFAKENGWYCKYNNSSTSSGLSYTPIGGTVNLDLTITVNSGNYDNYPYLDTLKYYTPKTGRLSNISEPGCYILEDTSGDYIRCRECDGGGRITCYNCDGDGSVICYECDGNGLVDCNECRNGKVNCSNCDGSGEIRDEEGYEIECDECSGHGSVDCADCDGEGRVDCSLCDGNGTRECHECDGRGDTPCPECD
jgi:putative transposon-encoded protein